MAKPTDYQIIDFFHHVQNLSPGSVNTVIKNFSTRSFTILHMNMRSLINKMPLFEVLLAQLNVHFSCIVISETWFSQNEFLEKYSLYGYKMFCRSRFHGAGGGIAMYVSEEFEASVTDVRLSGSEAMVVRMTCSGRPVCSVLAVYRTPSVGPAAFLVDWEALLPSLPINSIVVGDLNFDLNPSNETDNFTLDYMRIMSMNGFFNIIESPTRCGRTKDSILDHILVNNTSNEILSCTVKTDMIADHLPVISSIAFPNTWKPNQANQILITKLDPNTLYKKVNDPEVWQGVLNSSNPNDAFEIFTNTLQKLVAESSTTKTKKLSKKFTFKKPWMTLKIFKFIQQREKLARKLKDEPFNSKLLQKYSKIKNLTCNIIKDAKIEFYKTEFENVKSNQNEKWAFVNRLLNRKADKSSTPSCIETNGQRYTSENEIAECFNEFFTSVGSGLAAKLPECGADPLSYLSKYDRINNFDFLEITNDITESVINNSSAKKAVGYDGISMKIIKENKNAISPILTHMINLIVRTSKFPDSQKIARVRPLHKKGDKFDCNNYRPISILTAISKIAEKVLAIQLRFYLENSNILIDSQFGFREKRNTTSAISRLMEHLYDSFNNSKITQGIFLDFSKAFDTINHDILIKKLPFYNFTNDACDLLKSYLENRKQFVKINDHSSTMKKVDIGVPQGSVLGPILFLIFINDLVISAPMFKYILFADDTNIFSNDPEILKSNVHKIEQWCLSNKLILNYTKTFQVIFKSQNKQILDPEQYQLKLGNQVLETKNSTKFLGIHLDESIIFKTHILEVCRKLNYILFLMRSVRPYFDVPTMINLYYTFFYPHLIYGIEFYGHAANCHLNHIYLLQKSALRVILKIRPRGHVTSFFSEYQIMPIELLFKYRYLLHFNNTRLNGELEIQTPAITATRSKEKFAPKRANNCRGERSLLTTGVNLWNSHLLGEEGAAPSALRGRLASSLWGCGSLLVG